MARRGRQKKINKSASLIASAQSGAIPLSVKRPRGRPRKDAVTMAASLASSAVKPAVKQRGRPRKIVELAAAPKRIGRPPGSTNKNKANKVVKTKAANKVATAVKTTAAPTSPQSTTTADVSANFFMSALNNTLLRLDNVEKRLEHFLFSKDAPANSAGRAGASTAKSASGGASFDRD